MCEQLLGILFLFSLVIGAIVYFCWIGGKMAEGEVRSKYINFMEQDADKKEFEQLQIEGENKLAVASISKIQTVTLSFYVRDGWYCSFVDGDVLHRGFVSGLPEYGYAHGEEIRAKVVRFDEIYFLEKA